LLWQLLLDKEDAVVRLLVVWHPKTNKKKYVLHYPNDNEWLSEWHWIKSNRNVM
jgi:hypothetical protein